MSNSVENAKKNRKRPRNCPECKSEHLADRSGEECSVCLNCGFVMSAQTAQHGSETKNNANQRKCIQKSNSDKTNISLTEKVANHKNMVSVLEHWKQVKIGDATEKNLALCLEYLMEISVDLSLPKEAVEKASFVYKKIIEKKLVKGRSMKALAATAVYIGSKEYGLALTTKRVANISGISSRKITRFYRTLAKEISFVPKPSSVIGCVADLSERLQSSKPTITVMEKIAKELQYSKLLRGKDPTGVACAAIYISSFLTGDRRTRRQIAETARITEQTIRVRCREIEKDLVFVTSL